MRSFVHLVHVTALFLVGSLVSLVACEHPEPKAPQKSSNDGVPANSLSDARLHGEEDPKDKSERSAARDSKEDPTKPMTTRVGEGPPPDPASVAAGAPPAKGSKPVPAPGSSGNGSGGGKGAASKSECDRVMDKFLELELMQNPQLKDVPPEVIEQAKQMAREKHGDAPCTATRSQYTCAMSASSTTAWQRCMK